MKTRPFIGLQAIAAAIVLAACANREAAPPPNVLLAARVAAPPVRDGVANDAVWAAARPMTVRLTGGVNFAGGKGETTATMKAVASGDSI